MEANVETMFSVREKPWHGLGRIVMEALITMDVYGDNQNIIPEEIPELTSYIDNVLPKKTNEYSMELEVLDTVMEVEQYLQQIDAEE